MDNNNENTSFVLNSYLFLLCAKVIKVNIKVIQVSDYNARSVVMYCGSFTKTALQKQWTVV